MAASLAGLVRATLGPPGPTVEFASEPGEAIILLDRLPLDRVLVLVIADFEFRSARNGIGLLAEVGRRRPRARLPSALTPGRASRTRSPAWAWTPSSRRPGTRRASGRPSPASSPTRGRAAPAR